MIVSFTILLLAATKWMMAAMLVIALDMNFFWSLLLLWGGGMTGVLIYTYLGAMLFSIWRSAFPVPDRRHRINRFKRFIVMVRQRHGLMGIAFLTPIVLTVPGGTIAAAIIEPRRPRMLLYLAIAFAFWALVMCGFSYVVGDLGLGWLPTRGEAL
jgi:hypothetical protein